jgi:hypothetical protein
MTQTPIFIGKFNSAQVKDWDDGEVAKKRLPIELDRFDHTHGTHALLILKGVISKTDISYHKYN